MIGKQCRAFNSSLYDRHPWIEYSQSEDAIYCYHCRHFSTNRKEPTFVSQGLRNWKKCYGTKDSGNNLLQHNTSLQHAECVDSRAHYVAVKSGTFQSVAELQDSAHAKLVRENRDYMRTLCEVLLLTAQRKIAQRQTGRSYRVDDINVESLDFGQSCGNFLSIFSLIARHNLVVAERIRSGPRNAKYTHHSVQNALLDILKDMTLEQVKEELRAAEFFTILSDEFKDTCKKEQVVVAVRYCFNNAIHEEFIGVAEAQSLDADGLSDTIIHQLQRDDANMKNCVGQGYDGASVVSGHLNGVQKKIPEKTGAEMAYYVHYFCHSLNLVIVDVENSVKCVANVISLFEELHSFFSSSTVHVRWESKQKSCGAKMMEIGKVSDTRWSCQAKQFSAVWERIDIVIEVLQDVIDNDSNSSRTTEATGYMLQIDRRFLRYLLIIKHILKKAKFASDMLQKPTNDLTKAIDLIAALKEELQACRSRKKGQEFWDDAEKVGDRLNLPGNARPVRRRRPPAALRDCIVEASIEDEATGAGFDGYVWDVYEIVDKVNAELEKRFDDKNVVMMRGITALSLGSTTFMDENLLVAFAELFNGNTTNLRSEVVTFKHLLERKEEQEQPKSLLQLQAYLERLKETFFELQRLELIACTLPVSSAECERNFSSTRLIKNDLRSVMTQERLDSLMMLGIHRDGGNKLNLDTVVNRFKARFPKCRIAL